jgi:hypothetical protein
MLSEMELKKEKGGIVNLIAAPEGILAVPGDDNKCNSLPSCGDSPEKQYCKNKNCGDYCYVNEKRGVCRAWPNGYYYCKICYLG